MKERSGMYWSLILGIIGGIFGVVIYALEGLAFGFFAGLLLGLIGDQLRVYKSAETSEPQMLEPSSKKQEDVGMVINFADTKCNYCLLSEQEVEYYCPECKKPYCAVCWSRPEIAGRCPIDNGKLLLIPKDKKVSLREVKDESPTLHGAQKQPAVHTSAEQKVRE